MREVKAEPRAGASQGEKAVIAAGDTYAAALGFILRGLRDRHSRVGFALHRSIHSMQALQFGKQQLNQKQETT
jgi:hypothetical protein